MCVQKSTNQQAAICRAPTLPPGRPDPRRINPVSWTLYGLVTSQLGDVEGGIQTYEGGSVPIKVFLQETFG